ncbi:hypothetical protein, partial [Mesorhizobium sp.]|uniref:hypothetical protein n=1 Tax=Mesorhizobium sp. TaxID=1871066 RepID=UPI00257B8F45
LEALATDKPHSFQTCVELADQVSKVSIGRPAAKAGDPVPLYGGIYHSREPQQTTEMWRRSDYGLETGMGHERSDAIPKRHDAVVHDL